jgi:two-component system, OmpR family, response regulator RegX3
MQIAMLENDTRTAQLLESWLKSAGHSVQLLASGKAFVDEIGRSMFSAAILGSPSAEMTAPQVCAALRDCASAVPLIRILQSGSEADIVAALQAGADDCMADVRQHELLARVEALARRPINRTRAPAGDMLVFRNLSIDQKNRVVLRDGLRVPLTPKTYDLAIYLLTNRGRLLLRADLLEQLWGRDAAATTRTLDTHISRLRTVLGLMPDFGWQLQSVYQHGYRLDEVEIKIDRRVSAKPRSAEAAFT